MVSATGDPGLQPERTALAWTRTALAMAVNALLAIRAGFVAGEPWLVAIGVLLFPHPARSSRSARVRSRHPARSSRSAPCDGGSCRVSGS